MIFIINLDFTILANFTYYLFNLRIDFAPKTSTQVEKSNDGNKNLDNDNKIDDDKSKQSAKLSSSKISRKKIVSELEDEIEE